MINFEINKRLATEYIQDKKTLSVKKSAITNNVAFHPHDFFEIEYNKVITSPPTGKK